MGLVHRLRKPPLVIVLVALLLRIALVVSLGKYHMNPASDHWRFGWETGRVARSIAAGEGFSSPYQGRTGLTAAQAPVFPYLLAGVFKLFGIYSDTSGLVILCLNALLSALTCLPVLYIGERIFGRPVGTAAAWTWALLPTSIYITLIFVWETVLTTLLLSLVLLFTLRLQPSSPPRAWLGYGLLCGLTALGNPAVVSVLPLLGSWLWYRLRRPGAQPGRLLGAAALGFVLSISPWFVRNYRTFHQVMPFRSNFGLELQVGNNPGAMGKPNFALHPSHSPAELQQYRRLGEVAYMAEKKRQAVAFILSHPADFVRMTLARIIFWWTGVWDIDASPKFQWDASLKFLGFAMETFLAFLGLYLAMRSRTNEALPLAIMLVVFPLVYYVVFFDLRYRHPVEPAMVVLAVYALRRAFYAERAHAAVPAVEHSPARRALVLASLGQSDPAEPAD